MRAWVLLGVVVAVAVGVGAWTASHYLMRPEPMIAYSLKDRRMTFAVLPLLLLMKRGNRAGKGAPHMAMD